MLAINRQWWEHLAPKPMHRMLREVEHMLRQWCLTPYGAHWLAAATKPNGLIRVKPEQPIPVFHSIALGDQPIFVAPTERIRAGHRSVGNTEFQSGRPLDEDELAIRPEIRIEVVTDPILLAAAARREAPLHQSGVTQPSVIFSSPACYLLAPDIWPKKAYVLYQHIFGQGTTYPFDGYFYVGVTTRSWQARWGEHRRAIETGSPLLFHRKFREELSAERITYIHHKIMGITDDLEKLYATEEFLVEGHWQIVSHRVV